MTKQWHRPCCDDTKHRHIPMEQWEGYAMATFYANTYAQKKTTTTATNYH